MDARTPDTYKRTIGKGVELRQRGFNSVENLKVRPGGRGLPRVVRNGAAVGHNFFPFPGGRGRGHRLIPLFEEDPDPIAD